MNKIIKLGLATMLLVGGATAAYAEDATAAAAGAVKSTTSAAAGAAVDATTTGSIGNFGSLISSMNAGARVDLSSVTDASTVNFVKVSTLTEADPAAIDAALKTKAEAMTTDAHMDRSAYLARLRSTPEFWDIIVIGGGATGLGTALEAVSRG